MLCRTSLRTVACNRTREDRPKNLRPIFCLHRSPNIPAVQEPACTPRRCSRNRPHTMSARTDSKQPRQPRPELRCTAVRPVRALRRAPLAALSPQLLRPSQPRPPRIRPLQTRRPSPSWNSCDSRSCSARWKLSKHACSALPLRWLGGYSGFALHRVSKPVERGLDHDTCDKERRTFRKSPASAFRSLAVTFHCPFDENRSRGMLPPRSAGELRAFGHRRSESLRFECGARLRRRLERRGVAQSPFDLHAAIANLLDDVGAMQHAR
jgi:hypothetical protein